MRAAGRSRRRGVFLKHGPPAHPPSFRVTEPLPGMICGAAQANKALLKRRKKKANNIKRLRASRGRGLLCFPQEAAALVFSC